MTLKDHIEEQNKKNARNSAREEAIRAVQDMWQDIEHSVHQEDMFTSVRERARQSALEDVIEEIRSLKS